jgi:hypothetical protein
MTSPITLVEINGFPLDLDNVEYSIYLTHGRSRVTDGPTPSSASITIIPESGSMPYAPEIGQVLRIEAHNLPRFRGQITDLTFTHVIDGVPRYSIQATGVIARMGNRYVPIYYPSSPTVNNAVQSQVLQSLGYGSFDPSLHPLEELIMGGRDQILNVVDPAIMNPPNALSYVGSTADWIGGAVVDYPDGSPLIQFYDARSIVPYQVKWRDKIWFEDKWNVQIGDWTQQTITYPTAEEPLTLDSGTIVFEPVFNQQLGEIINSVSIRYGTSGGGGGGGGGGGSRYRTDDPVSISKFGVRELSLDTELANVGDAVVRANSILVRQANPRWQIGGVEILMDEITDPAFRDQIMELICGRRVQLINLPAPGVLVFVGIVEGWSEVFLGVGGEKGIHRMTLALSDPLLSYAVMPWSLLTTQTWSTINSSVIWADAISLETLI